MTATLADLTRWLTAPAETEHLEFKEAKNTYADDKVLKYVCALANEGGGHLVLGVTDKPPRRVVGSQALRDRRSIQQVVRQRMQIGIDVEELAHPDGRVVVVHIPSRPIGKPLQVDGAYWMRSTEDVVPMSSERIQEVLEEAGPDFTEVVCAGLTISDLDPVAIARLLDLWAKKSKDDTKRSLPPKQALADLGLMDGDNIRFAAVILLGSRDAIKKHLSSAEVIFEYRSSDASIEAQQRQEWKEAALLVLDDLWNLIALRNDVQRFREGLFVGEIPTFNEDVVREALLNAIAHRDYRDVGSVFVKQWPRRLQVESPGGLPKGITTENIISRQKARNRLLAETLQKIGLVERSGQGMDRMFRDSIREGKATPVFTGTDEHTVVVTLLGEVQDTRFLRYLEKLGTEKLTLFSPYDFIALDRIRREQPLPEVCAVRVPFLIEQGAVERVGRDKLILSKDLYAFLGERGSYTRKKGLAEGEQRALLLKHIDENPEGSKLPELRQVLPSASESTVKRLLGKLKADSKVHPAGSRRWAVWKPGPAPSSPGASSSAPPTAPEEEQDPS